VVGDRKYGARSTLMALDGKPRVALHARSLTFTHPTRAEKITVTAEVPTDWPVSENL
jgi:23S rRNA-/tRNA-specific pseudouridylate synthase